MSLEVFQGFFISIKKAPNYFGALKLMGGRPVSNRRPSVPQTDALTN